MKKFTCENGHTNECAVVDGYSVSNMLEDLKFKVSCKDGVWSAELKDPDDEAFFGQFNQPEWIDRIKEHAAQEDVFECYNGCGEDVYEY